MAILKIGTVNIEYINALLDSLPKQPWAETSRENLFSSHKCTRSLVLKAQHTNGAVDLLNTSSPCEDTPTRKELSAIEPVLDAIKNSGYGENLHRIIIASLNPYSEITPHVDGTHYFDDKFRVHVPLVTNNKVEFLSEEKIYNMKVGEIYRLDNLHTHGVVNKSNVHRIHLIVDVN